MSPNPGNWQGFIFLLLKGTDGWLAPSPSLGDSQLPDTGKLFKRKEINLCRISVFNHMASRFVHSQIAREAEQQCVHPPELHMLWNQRRRESCPCGPMLTPLHVHCHLQKPIKGSLVNRLNQQLITEGLQSLEFQFLTCKVNFICYICGVPL